MGKEVCGLGEFRIGEEVRRAEMLALTLKCVTGYCDTEGAWRPTRVLICYLAPQVAICPFCLLEIWENGVSFEPDT